MQFSSWSRGTEMVGGTELIQGVGVRWAYFYLMILFCFPWRSETRLSELPGWANTEWIGTVGDILSPEQHFAGAEVEVHLMLCPSPDRPLSATQRNVGSQSSQCSRSSNNSSVNGRTSYITAHWCLTIPVSRCSKRHHLITSACFPGGIIIISGKRRDTAMILQCCVIQGPHNFLLM